MDSKLTMPRVLEHSTGQVITNISLDDPPPIPLIVSLGPAPNRFFRGSELSAAGSAYHAGNYNAWKQLFETLFVDLACFGRDTRSTCVDIRADFFRATQNPGAAETGVALAEDVCSVQS